MRLRHLLLLCGILLGFMGIMSCEIGVIGANTTWSINNLPTLSSLRSLIELTYPDSSEDEIENELRDYVEEIAAGLCGASCSDSDVQDVVDNIYDND